MTSITSANTESSLLGFKNKEAWEKFVYHGEIPQGVRKLILESWQRCAQMKVDPFSREIARIIPPKELIVRKKRRKDLLQTAKPYIKTLYKAVEGSGFIIFLADEEGVVLLLDGDPLEIERFKRINLVEGAVWSEKEAGTNAVGTAIIIGQPVQIVGCEHYCATQHSITCSAAPIFDGEHKMIGILNMSADSEKVHPHTLGMVIAAAKAIENEIQIKKALEDIIKANAIMKTTLVSVPEGVMTIDEKSFIRQLNPKVAGMFGLKEEDVIGKFVDDVFKCSPPLSSVVEKAAVMDNVEVICESGKNTLRYTIITRPIINEDGKIMGAVIVIHGKETIHRLVNEITGAQAQFTFHAIIGRSKKLERAKEIARTAALTNSTVLLLGESGTGKELFAQSIHNASRRKGPFIAVNCSAIPRTLIESELFGYEAGSFTGANRNGRPGKFERANGGTIFLDEIGDMPLDLQAVLLRVLQERQVVRVGGFKPIPIDVRVIAATNKDLAAKVAEGTFREDLYFRLNVVTINIPPLRERKEDIPLLVEYMLPQISKRLGKKVTGITPRALKCLQDYNWPGNVRELENILERGVVVAQGEILDCGDIPETVLAGQYTTPVQQVELLSLAEIERRAIINTLNRVPSIVEAAKVLGISRSTLYRKIDQYNIPYKED
ncbi:Acetoin dehydrogenase operon transcriptional activator AcoR [Moorella humiferrea]|uniref:sigma-54-dependent Fis family transcriptional regulator n=1 Tax=Neomoorella humiferrea TaxID=676965 RepID=UPI0030CBCED5